MAWPSVIVATAVSPVGTAAGDIVSYILGYGVLGVVVLAFAFRYVVPRGQIEASRADLIAELERVRQEKTHAEEQRDEAMRIAQTQIVPLLGQFTATTGALLPLLQEMIRYREHREAQRDPGPGRH